MNKTFNKGEIFNKIHKNINSFVEKKMILIYYIINNIYMK